MALIPREPMSTLGQLQREINRLFDVGPAQDENGSTLIRDWAPAADIREEEDRYVVSADIPGVDPKDIEVTLENGVLTIRGERSQETKEESEKYRRVERVRGTFMRRFSLPDTADAEKVSAASKNGVLEVSIPKGAAAKPRRITVDG